MSKMLAPAYNIIKRPLTKSILRSKSIDIAADINGELIISEQLANEFQTNFSTYLLPADDVQVNNTITNPNENFIFEYKIELENEIVCLYVDSEIKVSMFVDEYLKYKDEDRIKIEIKMNLFSRLYKKIIIVVWKPKEMFIYKKGYTEIFYLINEQKWERFKEDLHCIYKKFESIKFIFVQNEQVQYFSETLINDTNKNVINEYEEGFVAFIYIKTDNEKLNNDPFYCQEIDKAREAIYKSYAFYRGRIVSNCLKYSIFEFKEALSSIHWAVKIRQILSKMFVIVNNDKLKIDFKIGIAHGTFQYYEEYKGGRNSFAGIALNKAARIARVNSETNIVFCDYIFNVCKDKFEYLDIKAKYDGKKIMKGFLEALDIYCI
ncbi:hypothetical protein GVAV_003535 [Gurleya vavrai]